MENSRSTTLQLIYLNTAFAVIGCLAALSAVLLILLTKAYHQYVHRLQLYLAILCLGFAAAVGLETLPVSTDVNATVTVREGWGDACVAIGCIVQYFGFSLTFCMLWICAYVFMVAVCQIQLRRLRHEISGLVIVLTLPTLVTWIPLIHGSYGLGRVWCWTPADHDRYTAGFQLGLSKGLTVLLHTISLFLVFTAVVKFCKGLSNTRDELEQTSYRVALKEVLPLTIFPSFSSIANVISATKGIVDVATVGPDDANISEMVVLCAIPVFMLSLPLSLLPHRRIRCNLCRRPVQFTESHSTDLELSHQISKMNETEPLFGATVTA